MKKKIIYFRFSTNFGIILKIICNEPPTINPIYFIPKSTIEYSNYNIGESAINLSSLSSQNSILCENLNSKLTEAYHSGKK